MHGKKVNDEKVKAEEIKQKERENQSYGRK